MEYNRDELIAFYDWVKSLYGRIPVEDLESNILADTFIKTSNSASDESRIIQHNEVQKEPCKNCDGKGYGWVEDLKQYLPCECTFRQGG